MVAESWFQSLWNAQKKEKTAPHLRIEVLAFEVASMMSKLVLLWKSLSDKQVAELRDNVTNSVVIKKLISDDDDYIVCLISSEIIENLGHVAKAVARLSKKCTDPYLKRFENVFKDMIKIGEDPYGWNYTWKKMDRKARKMERFILMNSNLYRSLESLSELSHTFESIKVNEDPKNVTLVEYEKKIAWKKQEVKQFKEFSLWNRSYDYVVRLLARSVFTVYRRFGYVFGIGPMVDFEIKDSKVMDSDYIFQGQSVSTLQSSSDLLLNMSSKSVPIARPNGTINLHSTPFGKSKIRSSPLYGEKKSMSFYSGPLEPSSTRTGTLNRPKKKLWKTHKRSFKHEAKTFFSSTIRFQNSLVARNSHLIIIEPKHNWINAPPETLGAAALALHYANVIIVIEKFAETPHLIDRVVRDDLYNMLPSSVRVALKAKLQPLNLSNYDSALTGEWSEAVSEILECLGPLAHNTIRWQTERSFEHQILGSRANVLLVQTLYFANHVKTEAMITEILVGLNYVWRYSRELNAKPFMEYANDKTIGGSFEVDSAC